MHESLGNLSAYTFPGGQYRALRLIMGGFRPGASHGVCAQPTQMTPDGGLAVREGGTLCT